MDDSLLQNCITSREGGIMRFRINLNYEKPFKASEYQLVCEVKIQLQRNQRFCVKSV